MPTDSEPFDALEWVTTPFKSDRVRIAVTTAAPEPLPLGGRVFNLGLNVGDDPERVQARRRLVEQAFGAPVVWLNQVHDVDVLDVSNPLPLGAECFGKDGSVTALTGVVLSVLTADCLPAVFYAPGAVGVAHAGWRGLAGGVLEKTALAVAEKARVSVGEVEVWLGPAIGPRSFEVGTDVLEAFEAAAKTAPDESSLRSIRAAFKPCPAPNKFKADLYALARLRLLPLTSDVHGGGEDTFSGTKWFSHRAFAQSLGRPAGRFATLIQRLP